ncbi:MAG: hypothetical protein J6X30_03115 [Clostridia bacterium]|nr:hypothetical protein [Clostridia bacterium]
MGLEEQIDEAYRAWQQAIAVFNNAETPEDIDYAVYNMEAKRRHYTRLMAQMRAEKQEHDFE